MPMLTEPPFPDTMLDAGTVAAGTLYSPPPPPPPPAQQPAALLFDGLDFPLDEGGQYKSAHPVDQEVALALMVGLQKLAAVPTVGSTLRDIQYAGGRTLVSDVTNRVRIALRRLYDRGDIEDISLDVQTPVPGRIAIKYVYRNLRAPASKPDQQVRQLSL